MLPKKNRIPIQNLPKTNFKRLSSSNLTLKIFPSTLSFPRFGIIISKKTAKTAVARNLLKRTAFHVVEIFLKKIKPADYLIIINKNLPKENLQKELIDILKSTTLNLKP